MIPMTFCEHKVQNTICQCRRTCQPKPHDLHPVRPLRPFSPSDQPGVPGGPRPASRDIATGRQRTIPPVPTGSARASQSHNAPNGISRTADDECGAPGASAARAPPCASQWSARAAAWCGAAAGLCRVKGSSGSARDSAARGVGHARPVAAPRRGAPGGRQVSVPLRPLPPSLTPPSPLLHPPRSTPPHPLPRRAIREGPPSAETATLRTLGPLCSAPRGGGGGGAGALFDGLCKSRRPFAPPLTITHLRLSSVLFFNRSLPSRRWRRRRGRRAVRRPPARRQLMKNSPN